MGRQGQNFHPNLTLVGLILCALLLAYARAENTTDPTANVNLSPFQAWRSAEYCLRNTSDVCPSNHTLNDLGWLNVTKAEGASFCKEGGCADHTRAVLLCLAHVMKNYWFANKATIKDLNDTINLGCGPRGFTGISLHGSHK